MNDKASVIANKVSQVVPEFGKILRQEMARSNSMRMGQAAEPTMWDKLKDTFSGALDTATQIYGDRERAKGEYDAALKVAEAEAAITADQMRTILMTAQDQSQKEAAATEAAAAERFIVESRRMRTGAMWAGAAALVVVSLLFLVK